jgi:O-antigen/teichoic acid export membrane protein
VGAVGTAIMLAAAGRIAQWLLGSTEDRELVVWAVAAGGLAAVWRVAANSLRLERRPWAYLVVTGAQHLLGIAIAIPLLEDGQGVGGVIGALAIGNLVAALIALWLIRRNVRPAVSWFDAVNIMRRGRAMLPVIASTHFIQLADVLIMSRFVASSGIGLYRVASRLGTLVTYWSSSFNMAWGSLRRGPLQAAAEAERGSGVVASLMATYFSLITFGVMLALSLFSEELIRLAAPGYEDAAPLVPLAAAAWASHGFYIVAYRTAEFPSRRAWFIGLTTLAAVAFAASALVLIPLWGTYGAPAAVITGWLVGGVGMVARAQRGPTPTPYQYGRIVGGLLVAAGCLIAAKLFGPEGRTAQFFCDLVALAAYPLLLAALTIVPKRHIVSALGVIRVALGSRWSKRIRGRLTPEDYAVIALLIRGRRPLAEVAHAAGVDEDEMRRRLVEALRRCTDLGGPREQDEMLADYLLMRTAFAEQEAAAREMFADGVDPLDADVLSRAATALGRLSGRRWRKLKPPGEDGWPAPAPSTELPADRAPQTR